MQLFSNMTSFRRFTLAVQADMELEVTAQLAAVPDSFPLSNPQEMIDQCAKARKKVFDLRYGNLQFALHPDDLDNTAFQVESCRYCYLVVPIGLFLIQQQMNKLFYRFIRKGV
jgi:hypothetical protein